MDTEPLNELKSRPYQVELEEIAIKKNTIIHLPTGSGKTFIAIRVIIRLRNALFPPWGQGGKRTFFLVNNVPLVNQQKKVIESLCPVTVVGYSSEDKVDYWDKQKWDSELNKYQVIVMTSQILCDMLTHAYIRVSDINLLIFDECHHAVDDHPMRAVMKHFENYPVEYQPRVIGLTATLLNSNIPSHHKIEVTLRELETTFHATIATVNELGEVLSFSTNPKEHILVYKSYVVGAGVREAVGVLSELSALVGHVQLPVVVANSAVVLKAGQRDISSDPKKVVKAVNNMIVGMIGLLQELGPYGGALGVLAYIVLLERLKRKALNPQETLLFTFCISHCTLVRSMLMQYMEKDEGYDKIVKHSSEQVLMLLDILKEYSPNYMNKPGVTLRMNRHRKPLSSLIFTRQRFTSKVLYNLLKDVKEANPDEFGFLNHDFVVGFNINPLKWTREQHYLKKSSQKALLQFNNRELNCLICTSVIEEGIDIPQCLLVVRFDPPLEYRSYIQSKGRARSSQSNYVMMIKDSDITKFNGQYRQFQTNEKYIQNVLVGSSDQRHAPTLEDIQDGLYDEDIIPPYVTEHNRLAAVSAISLLNRYCMTLPHDQFTTLTPMWIQEKVHTKSGELNLISIIMPISCPVKEQIQGTPYLKLKDAKRSAALNSCIRLHQTGELDNFTLLPRAYGAVDYALPDYKQCFLNWPWDEPEEDEDLPRPGTKKRVRKHPKVFPLCLKGPENWAFGQMKFHLHLIKLEAAFEEPKDSREHALYTLLKRHGGFGFLTHRPLPPICSFPMFHSVGQVDTSIEVNYAVVPLDLNYFEIVKFFHLFLFDQVLGIAKKFIVHSGRDNGMYVVPVRAGGRGSSTPAPRGSPASPSARAAPAADIDWELMQAYTHIPPATQPSFEERKALRVTREDYRYKVVSPWYRASIHPDRYIVSDVLEYMCPSSRFGSVTFTSYEEYYQHKYGLDVVGSKDQPMLEARSINSRMNCIMPRAATINAFSEKQARAICDELGDDAPRNFQEIFIPEFCVKYDFPGDLWFKATILPSILHRVYMLLVAEELRAKIASEAGLGVPILPQGEKWSPIQVDIGVVTKSLRSYIEEPNAIASIDRINNPIDESNRRPLHIMSMKESLYQLQKKRLNEEYPWNESNEPMDIERNLSAVTVMDIECYDEFMSAALSVGGAGAAGVGARLAHLASTHSAPAKSIMAAPVPEYRSIELLSRTDTDAGRGPELRGVLAALTTCASHDTFDLERAETLGDSFLKYAATLYLFHKFPALNEGQLTNIKCRLIGNRNLYYAGERIGLGGRMKVEQFTPKKDFIVPGFFAPEELQKYLQEKQLRPTFLIGMQFQQSEILSGNLTQDTWETIERRCLADGEGEYEPPTAVHNSMQCYVKAQAVSDKSVADCVEALIGTYLLDGGVTAGVRLLEWLRVIPPGDNLEKYLTQKIPTAISENRATPMEVEFLLNHARPDVERILGYKFKDPALLLEALSHPSYTRNRLTRSYERLEFLGDAILDFLITSYIFENSANLKPGDLTDLRSALVNNVTFAAYVVKLGLHKFICSQLNTTLDKAIMEFVEHQQQRNHEIIEDVLYLIDESDCQVAEYVEVPKVLSDIFEALMGAVYVDSGGALGSVWRVVHAVMRAELAAFSARIPRQPVRALLELSHACAVFGKAKLIDMEVPKMSVPVSFTKFGQQHTVYGCGSNKFQAKRAAAKLALKILSI